MSWHHRGHMTETRDFQLQMTQLLEASCLFSFKSILLCPSGKCQSIKQTACMLNFIYIVQCKWYLWLKISVQGPFNSICRAYFLWLDYIVLCTLHKGQIVEGPIGYQSSTETYMTILNLIRLTTLKSISCDYVEQLNKNNNMGHQQQQNVLSERTHIPRSPTPPTHLNKSHSYSSIVTKHGA